MTDKTGWQDISTAPKDGAVVVLRDETHKHVATMSWDKRRKLWVGLDFGVMGPRKTYWDETFCPIHEWRPAALPEPPA